MLWFRRSVTSANLGLVGGVSISGLVYESVLDGGNVEIIERAPLCGKFLMVGKEETLDHEGLLVVCINIEVPRGKQCRLNFCTLKRREK